MTDHPLARRRPPTLTDLAESFHANTKFHRHHVLDEEDPAAGPAGLPDPTTLAYVPLDDAARVPLPPPTDLGGVHLADVLLRRRSHRRLAGTPVPLAALGDVLHAAYGVTGALDDGAPGRAAPSAGARYPLELFTLTLAVDGLAPGIHHYHPPTHTLEPVQIDDPRPLVHEAFLRQPWLTDAAFILVIAACFHRTTAKYGERGYRLILLDAGHAGENAWLAAAALGLGATGLGGFLDDVLNARLGLDGVDENVVYALAVGARAP